jgi:hypothetical protein
MAERSAIQRIKELDDERAKLFDQAKEETLQKTTAAVAEFNALGLNYTSRTATENHQRRLWPKMGLR